VYEGAFTAEPSSVGSIRDALGGVARACGLDERGVSAVLLAVSEAVTNAIMHGYRGEAGTIRVSASRVGEELEVVVADSGGGHRPRLDSTGAGLGMPIMAALARRVEIRSTTAGTAIHLSFDCSTLEAG
jgi:anti-sigma regulatory factor (Ser/Thr protein kinase)